MLTATTPLGHYFAEVARVTREDMTEQGESFADAVLYAFGMVDPDDFEGADVSASFEPTEDEIGQVRAIVVGNTHTVPTLASAQDVRDGLDTLPDGVARLEYTYAPGDGWRRWIVAAVGASGLGATHTFTQAEARAFAFGAWHELARSPDTERTAHLYTRTGELRPLRPAERSAYLAGRNAAARVA